MLIKLLIYNDCLQYWRVLSNKEDERKGRIQNLRLKGSRKKIQRGTSIQPIPLDETSDNSICDRNNSNGNTSDPSIEGSNTPSNISECLRYAKEVSDIFSSSIKSEKVKWNSLRIAGKKSNVVDEETVWKQAKRVAKMVAIQNKNLDRLVELVMVNTSKECPSYDVTELKNIAKANAKTTNEPSPGKGTVSTTIDRFIHNKKSAIRTFMYFLYNKSNCYFQMPQLKKV